MLLITYFKQIFPDSMCKFVNEWNISCNLSSTDVKFLNTPRRQHEQRKYVEGGIMRQELILISDCCLLFNEDWGRTLQGFERNSNPKCTLEWKFEKDAKKTELMQKMQTNKFLNEWKFR